MVINTDFLISHCVVNSINISDFGYNNSVKKYINADHITSIDGHVNSNVLRKSPIPINQEKQSS